MQTNQEPLILTWNPVNGEQFGIEPSESISGSGSSLVDADGAEQHRPPPSLNSPTQPTGSIPLEDPPTYATASKPTRTVAYLFSPNSFNSMILIPPASAQDTRPRYYISVHTNCFSACAWITNVYRGSNEYGEYVGDFEMGLSVQSDTVCLKGREVTIDQKLRKGYSQTSWTWILKDRTRTTPRKVLTWTSTKADKNDRTKIDKVGHYVCTLDVQTDHDILARFTPKITLRKPNEAAPLAQLEVTPDGHEYFDDILMSLLIIERARLTSNISTKFSFMYM